MGDRKTFLVNTTGWVSWEDVFPEYVSLLLILEARI